MMKALLQEGGCDDTYQKHHIKSHIGEGVDKQALLRGGSEGYQKQMYMFLVELEVPERAIWLGSLDSWEKMQENHGESCHATLVGLTPEGLLTQSAQWDRG